MWGCRREREPAITPVRDGGTLFRGGGITGSIRHNSPQFAPRPAGMAWLEGENAAIRIETIFVSNFRRFAALRARMAAYRLLLKVVRVGFFRDL